MPVRKAHPQRKKDPSALTVKEQRVLGMKNEGKGVSEISAELGVDPGNIKRAFKLIEEKLACQ